MQDLTPFYEIRMFDIQAIRNVFMSQLNHRVQEWNRTHIPWQETNEACFTWMIKECIERYLRSPVVDHYHCDFGKYMLAELKGFEFNFLPIIEQAQYRERGVTPQHAQVMVLGSVLIIGTLN